MKESKMQGADKDYKGGYKAGQKWAKEAAELKELQRLNKARQDKNFEIIFKDSQNGGAGFFMRIIDSESGATRDAFFEFWENNAETRDPSLSLTRGFWDAALKVYDEIKGKIR